MKVKYLREGLVVWYKSMILGITGATLSKEYDECEVKPVGDNALDLDLIPANDAMKEDLELKLLQEEEEEW